MQVRLQKFLANCGIASRRASEEIILKGRVKVNGKIVKTLGFKVDPKVDKVEVDGIVCREKENWIYIILNKPKGVLTTVKDSRGRPTVIDILKKVKERVFPVGRLDKDTEGLLLLTNDGDLTYKLTHPKFEVPKTYLVSVKGTISEENIVALEKGLKLEDGVTAPAKVRVIKKSHDSTVLKITIHEGRKRQVRRMFEHIGHPVEYLKRTNIGDISLQNLKVGKWRYLSEEEIKYLKSL